MTDVIEFKTKPWAHQLKAYEQFKDAPFSALFFEQRVGKSLTSLIIAAHKFRSGEIDSLLVIAPAGVHRNWHVEEIPMHLPVPFKSVLWQSSKMDSARAKKELEELLEYRGGLRILSVNIDALITKKFRDYLTKFFFRRKVMTVVDESSDISSDKAQRSKMAVKIGRRSKARMILDGTPVAAGPLGLFSQCDFLAPGTLGFTSFVSFRARYAELEPRDVGELDKLCPICFNSPKKDAHGEDLVCDRCHGVGFIGRHQIQVVKKFLHIDELQEKLKGFSMRVLRSDCHDLPPKIFQKIFVDLPPETRKVYDELRTQFITELKSGEVVSVPLILVRYLRLQQVASGFLPVSRKLMDCPACGGSDQDCVACDGLGVIEDAHDQGVEAIGVVNHRLKALTDQLEKLEGQTIVWCRFTYDTEIIMTWLRETGRRGVRYDGQVKPDERAANVKAFQNREVQYFVGSPRAGGRGLDLPADVVCYYSHYWSLRTRLQSEDRAQSLKRALAGEKQDSVLYLDIIAADTVDDKIVGALRSGKRLSDLITGDKIEEWL